MNTETQSATRQTHPLVLVAAGGVLVASLAVTGVATGLIKTGSDTADAQPTAQEIAGSDATGAAGRTDANAGSAATAVAPKPQAPVVSRPRSNSVQVAAATPAAAPAPVCRDCGEVIEVNAIQREGQGTGLGAIAGGLAGALLGKQIGNGNGQKVATVAGAIGGAYAGNQIEKNARADMDYRVVVRYTDGTTQQFNFDNQPAWRVGDDVKVVNGQIVSR